MINTGILIRHELSSPLCVRNREGFNGEANSAENVNCNFVSPWLDAVERWGVPMRQSPLIPFCLRLGQRLLLAGGCVLMGVIPIRAEWTTPSDPIASSTGGAKISVESDGALLASYERPEPSTQTVDFDWPRDTFQGFRLQALTDPRLLQNGPGWAPHGNFILAHLSLAFTPPDGQTTAIPIEHAYTDHEQDGWTLHATLADDDFETGWAIAGALGQNHTAYFAPTDAINIPPGSKLHFKLHQGTASFPDHQIGRFQIETTTDPADVARYFQRDCE